MVKYKAIIIDDEYSGRAVLSRLLQLYAPELDVVAVASTIAAAKEIISAEQPDIVFLDIRMHNESGFDLLENNVPHDFAVVFVTGHDEYAIPAIRADAVDYLLKPVDVDELKQAIERAKEKIRKSGRVKDESPAVSGVLTIHQHSKVIVIQPEEVIYAEAERRYCQLHLAGGSHYTVPKTLSDLQQLWPARLKFCRISRGILLNTKYIQSYSKTWPCLIHIIGGKTFEVSRRKKTEVLAILESIPLKQR